MRIHILPVGFDASVFTHSAGPLVKFGADKLITIHTPMTEEKDKVEKTINDLKKLQAPIEHVSVESKTFVGIVQEFIKLFNRFGESDEIFVHIGGGQRHLGVALVYASFFSKRNIKLIPVLEYGTATKSFEYAVIPQLSPIELTDPQKKILKLVAEKEGQTLRDLAVRQNGADPETVAPGILRHLRNLIEYHLVSFDPMTKVYTATETARFFFD